jgi:hypothetical protein
MIRKTLVIGEISNYSQSTKRHFSLTKGLGIASGFSNMNNSETYYLTKGETEKKNKLILKNITEIDDEFLEMIDFILLIREHNILDVIESNQALKKVLLNFNKKQKVGMKSDAIEWLWNKNYIKTFESKYDIKWWDFLEKGIDIICCQTEEYKSEALKLIEKRLPKFNDCYHSKIYNKIFDSRMGVFNKYPYDSTMKNPYSKDHSYCVDSYTSLKEGRALHPVCYTRKNRPYSFDKGEGYNTDKIILIYMGRIKTDQGKILFMMRDIMKKLGPHYELHIFPGRFVIPDCPVSVFSNKYGEHLQTLRDSIFSSCNNVIIHFPFNDNQKGEFLKYAEIGIDFSSTRPKNIKTFQGNAKLLEYCAYGLKVVTERNVINSFLVDNAKNGICIENIGTVDNYVEAIKKVHTMNFDRDFTIIKTLTDQN